MLLLQLFDNPLMLLYFIVALLIVITTHEFSHAWVAYHLGDQTPKYQKRLSLNPLRHLDPIGTIMLVLVGFGWGKPVMYNPNNLKHGKFDEFLIAIAGPLSSIILAFIFAIPYRLVANHGVSGLEGTEFYNFTNVVTELSLLIAAFNILPIPPLDGSKFLYLFIPENWKYWFERIGTPILFVIIFLSFLTQYNLLINIILKIAAWFSYLVRTFPAGLF
jgi:Zn-dependent protease